MMYFPVVLPKIFWGFVFNGNWSGLSLQELSWVDADDLGFYVKLYMTSKSLTLPVRFANGEMLPSMLIWLPAHPHLLLVVFDFKSPETGRTFFKLSLSDNMRITGWDSTTFDFNRMGVLFPDPENTQSLLSSLNEWYSSDRLNVSAIPRIQTLHITGSTDVWVCGILIRNMDFSHTQDMEYGKLISWGSMSVHPSF